MDQAFLQYEAKRWKIDLFTNENVKHEYVCHDCDNICKDAVELSCDVEHDYDSIQLYCENCLISIIAANNEQCPINNHSNPTYSALRRMRAKINNAKGFCPNSAEYEQSQLNKNNNLIMDTAEEKEGMNNKNNKNNFCSFNGNLSELIAHIPKCIEMNGNSKEIQTQMINLLKIRHHNLINRCIFRRLHFT
eukprot:80212_1